jgi:hypothetical protein
MYPAPKYEATSRMRRAGESTRHAAAGCTQKASERPMRISTDMRLLEQNHRHTHARANAFVP